MPARPTVTTRVRGGASRARGAGEASLERLTCSVDAAQAALKDLRKELSKGTRDVLGDLDHEAVAAGTARKTTTGKPATTRTRTTTAKATSARKRTTTADTPTARATKQKQTGAAGADRRDLP
jgi:hypothetical protein